MTHFRDSDGRSINDQRMYLSKCGIRSVNTDFWVLFPWTTRNRASNQTSTTEETPSCTSPLVSSCVPWGVKRQSFVFSDDITFCFQVLIDCVPDIDMVYLLERQKPYLWNYCAGGISKTTIAQLWYLGKRTFDRARILVNISLLTFNYIKGIIHSN